MLIATEQLVGICLFIFVRSTLVPYIRDLQVDQVKTASWAPLEIKVSTDSIFT